ncbi:MAG TPA: reverse transcriptase-like protein [Candidatus Acidoferrales bacterium]|nr:reverse transcriptase-like protein [Candidatus Acidoferrales bacterium]
MSPSRMPPPATARLFSDAHAPAAPAGVHIANIDGASRGNPGPAAYAVVLRDPDGRVILELAKQFGRDTNNVAEYYALLAALDYASTHDIAALRIRSDSELLVRQMQGAYKVKSEDLKPLYERALRLSRQFRYFAIEHVRRELNREADALANVALDQGAGARSEIRKEAPAAGPRSSEDAPTNNSPQPPKPRRIRARFERGVLVPAEPLDLPEGASVILQIQNP